MYQSHLHVSYALEVFDVGLNITEMTRSDAQKMRFQGTGFARLDINSLELQSIAAFDKPLIPRRDRPCCDKNWGVVEVQDNLYIVYTMLPCLTIFRYDPLHEDGAEFVYASCIKNKVLQQLASESGLEMSDVRISGHPVLLSQYPQTLLVLVHHNWRKHGGSRHWIVQLHFDPLRSYYMISAISLEPVLDYNVLYLFNSGLQSGINNVIAVGSYHLSGGMLRILYGDGDKYAAFHDVQLSTVQWRFLDQSHTKEWPEGPGLSLGDRIDSITYAQYESMIW